MAMLRCLEREEASSTTSSTCTRRRPRDDVIFGEQLRRMAERQRGPPPARAAHRARATAGSTPGRPRSSSAPTGASARPSSAARRRCSTTFEARWKDEGLAERLHMERFQPIIGGDGAGEGEGGTIKFLRVRRPRRSRTAASRSWSPARRRALELAVRLPDGDLPHLRRQALLGPAARPAQRRGPRRGGRDGPHLRERARGRRSRSSFEPTDEEDDRDDRDRRPTESDASQSGETSRTRSQRLSEEQIEALGREFDAIHDEVFNDLGERDAKYIRSMIEMHRRLVVMGRAALVPSRFWPAWILGTASPLGGEDPREHGDRPQRHARPVGLDEQPRDPLLDLGLGHGLDQGGVEALPQLRPPHLHQHPRQGQGPRLRDHADRPAPDVAPGLPAAAVLQRRC